MNNNTHIKDILLKEYEMKLNFHKDHIGYVDNSILNISIQNILRLN